MLNSGISGNRILNDSHWFGDSVTTRFRRDVLDQPGVRTVILPGGINDIRFCASHDPTAAPKPRVSVGQLITAQRRLVHEAHTRALKVIGATLLPNRKDTLTTTNGQRVRDEYNTWIRTSGQYDAVVDLAHAMAAPGDPDRLDPAYDSGDHLHPNGAGHRHMLEAFGLHTL